jgi:hypothetical protein
MEHLGLGFSGGKMTDTQNRAPIAKSSAKNDDEIGRCLFAAKRKIDVARYHLVQLCERLDRTSKPQALPPIPVQAHFEGVVVSITAAEEKVKEALRTAYGVSRDDEHKCKRLYNEFARKLPALAAWYANASPLLGDIREVRNLAIHQYYEKRPITAGGPAAGWEVDKPEETRYEGPRELKEYSEAALLLGTVLRDLIPQIEELLRRDG